MKRDKFCFICGSFRPMNENHRKMIDYYSKNCDYVFVIISNPRKNVRKDAFGHGINVNNAKQIAEYVVEDSKWDNVKIKTSENNPIKTMLDYISRLKDCDVIVGTSDKDDDCERYKYLENNFKSDNNVKLLPITQNAYHVEDNEFSSSDIRNNIDNTEYVKKCLPTTLSKEHVNKIMNILQENTDFVASLEEDKKEFTASIFEELVKENDYDTLSQQVQNEMDEMEEQKRFENTLEFVDENDEMLLEEQRFPIEITDKLINASECLLNAYGMHVDETDETLAYNPKNYPTKAIDILLTIPQDNMKLEIFLDTNSLSWDSWINDKEGKLGPDQMQQFFKTDFYNRIHERLTKVWPEKDEQFKNLLEAIDNKRYKTEFDEANENQTEELKEGDEDDEEIKTRTHNVKLGDPNEKNASGQKIRSSSGRKLISFTDQGVINKGQKYYSWPGGTDDKHKFKWSRWCDWNKQRPFVRCRFKYSIGQNSDVIGLSLTPFEDDDKNRGFKSFNLSLRPILQYLTPEETQQILGLSMIRKFLKVCIQRITEVLNVEDEEIYRRINKPEKCTLEDIRKTKRVFKNTLKALREYRADTFVYT